MEGDSLSQLAGGSSSPPGAPQRGEGGLLDVKIMAAEPHLTPMSRA